MLRTDASLRAQGAHCDAVQRELSRRDGRVGVSLRLWVHVHGCARCARFRASIEQRAQDYAVLAPPMPESSVAAVLGALGLSRPPPSGPRAP